MISIAIDGPAGAGKSTIARAAARHFGFVYVDTGALYRAIGYFAAANGIATDDEAALVRSLPQARLEIRHREGEQRILLNGQDISDEIRSPAMSRAASEVSALPGVRAHLFRLQQEMAERYDVVMDGRDIGTVVLPNADLKIFLTASPEARAQRRYEEYLAKGQAVSYNDILEDMKQRDYNDTHRAVSPLRQAEDAVLLDTSGNELEQSIALVINTIQKRGIG